MSKKFMIIMMGLLVLLLAAVGGGLFMMWSRVSALDQVVNPPVQEESQAAVNEENEEPKIGPVIPLDSFIANLADPGGNRFLRATMELELANDDLTKEIPCQTKTQHRLKGCPRGPHRSPKHGMT